MSQMNIEIGGRSFLVTCQDGEEEHLAKLASMVDEKAGEAGDPAGLTESRMLLFTSLLLADELHGLKSAPPPAAPAPAPDPVAEQSVDALEKLADRAEQLANSLE